MWTMALCWGWTAPYNVYNKVWRVAGQQNVHNETAQWRCSLCQCQAERTAFVHIWLSFSGHLTWAKWGPSCTITPFLLLSSISSHILEGNQKSFKYVYKNVSEKNKNHLTMHKPLYVRTILKASKEKGNSIMCYHVGLQYVNICICSSIFMMFFHL